MGTLQSFPPGEQAGPPALFVLCQRLPVQPRPMSPTATEGFADDNNFVYAPAVLSVICDWMAENRSHTFGIRASATDEYDMDLDSCLLQILKPLPEFVAWIGDGRSPRFHLDIDRQGMDLRIEFTRSGDAIRHTCVEDFWQSAHRVEGDWEDTPASLLQCCRAMAEEVADVGLALYDDIMSFPAFREWCERCGCRFPRPGQ